MNSAPIVPARLDWPSAIGSFLLSFGSLEYFVFVYLKDHLGEAEFETVKKRHLAGRLERITQYLAGLQRAQQEQERFAQLVKRINPLREIRNQIAHGQMYVRRNPESGKCKLVLFLSKDVDNTDSPETRELEFSELERALKEIAAVNRDFERFVGFEVTQERRI